MSLSFFLEYVVIETVSLCNCYLYFSHYSEGVSCQSQRGFPQEMGESSTGEREQMNAKHPCSLLDLRLTHVGVTPKNKLIPFYLRGGSAPSAGLVGNGFYLIISHTFLNMEAMNK